LDGELVERARAGDADAFDQLVRERLDAVYRLALGILGEAADARDATQETFVAVWRKLPTLREIDRFDAWLDRITVNACRMALRKRRGVRELRMTPGADFPSTDRSTAQADAMAAAFDGAFDRLSVDQRALLFEHHLDGRGVAEISERLGIPAGTVKSRLFTARRALEKALGQTREKSE
jgi:RNA polymerase sigma-70 factor (ECF subfamily)